jgi:UDPglucose--hexose-1-phosphate uridylyltransferase
MPELRQDPVTGRWVVISSERRQRPNEFRLQRHEVARDGECPFCPGREDLTPPEVLAYRDSGLSNGPGWDLRVVPNKFPALQVAGQLDCASAGDGMFERMNGIGAHEVVIETPDHQKTLASMTDVEIERVLSAYRERVRDLRQDSRLRCILPFKNHGGPAGATLEHPHSQLIALPIVPVFVREEIEGARRHYLLKERCVFCDMVREELAKGARIILENADIVALAPYASRFPFETWLLPRHHGARFEDAVPHEYASLARLLRELLRRVNAALDSPSYNLIFHTSPFSEDTTDFYHWHLELLPQLSKAAGFEWATGLYINPTSPEEAARVLREARG